MPPEPIEVKHVLARNLRAAAAAAELRQERIRKRMNNLGFTSWVGSTVSLVMRGRRRVTAEELVGLALVLDSTPGQLLAVSDDDESQFVSLPSGFAFPGRRLYFLNQSVTWKDDEPVLAASSAEGEPDIAKLANEGAEKFMQRLMQQAAEQLANEGWTPPRAAAQPVAEPQDDHAV